MTTIAELKMARPIAFPLSVLAAAEKFKSPKIEFAQPENHNQWQGPQLVSARKTRIIS